MNDETMPVAEAETAEQFSYELAFHVLPTVAEGEVTGVFDAVKTHITNAGGTLGVEEAPARIDLAYEIVKHLEGKNRRFTSAYFGWVRFTSEAAAIEAITEGLEEESNVLRHLLIRLTRVEEEHPFYYHEALAAQQQVTDVEESAVVPDVTTVEKTEETPAEEAKAEETEESAEVDSKELDEALEKEETDK